MAFTVADVYRTRWYVVLVISSLLLFEQHCKAAVLLHIDGFYRIHNDAKFDCHTEPFERRVGEYLQMLYRVLIRSHLMQVLKRPKCSC